MSTDSIRHVSWNVRKDGSYVEHEMFRLNPGGVVTMAGQPITATEATKEIDRMVAALLDFRALLGPAKPVQ